MNWRYIAQRVLIAVIISVTLGFIHKAHAGLVNLSNADFAPSRPSTFVYDGEVWQYSPSAGTSTAISSDITAMDNFRLPTSSGRVPVTIERKALVNLPRVGGAVVKLMKRGLPLVGTALALREFVCETTYVCQNDDGSSQYQPPTVSSTVGTWYNPYSPVRYTTGSQACDHGCYWYYLHHDGSDGVCYMGTQNGHHGNCYANGGFLGLTVDQDATCPAGYSMNSDGNCTSTTAPTEPIPVDEDRWNQTQQMLSTMQAAQQLANAGEPVPVDAPRVTGTPSTPLSSSTTTLRDNTGTATGTETKTTTAKVSPPPVGSVPNTATYNETTVVTTTNITNNTTNTSTTVTSPPDNTTDEPDVTFDNVPDSDLPHQDFDGQYQPQDWGGGSCPPDPSVTYLGHSYSLPVHTVCDFSSGIHNIVLLLCGIVCCFIIAGAKDNL